MQDRINLYLNLAELRMLMQNDSLSAPLMEYLTHRHQELLDMQLRTVQLNGKEIDIILSALGSIESDLPEYKSAFRKLESA